MSILIQKSVKAVELLTKYSFELQDAYGDTRVINEELLGEYEAAKERARSEFIENSYSSEEVIIETYQQKVGVGDVISIFAPTVKIPENLANDRFIVKRVENFFNDSISSMKIIVERYNDE